MDDFEHDPCGWEVCPWCHAAHTLDIQWLDSYGLPEPIEPT